MKKTKKISRNIYSHIKNAFDFSASLLTIFLAFPIFIIIAILIKLGSRGPIFFVHKRIGQNKKKFNCLKFRTMHPEAEDLLKNLLSKNNDLKKEYQKDHKIKNDPRITPIGKFLRKTSLDEIPKFINVIKGDMSIVGPRPIVKEEVSKYGTSFHKVFSVRPGITGLWQVSGRNNLSYEKRVQIDKIYAQNRNFLMDLRIIFRTLGVILFPRDRGAY